MFDILQFIDSPDIREYNKNTKFTPSEQVILIAKSKRKEIEDKIKALKYLLEVYSESDWEHDSISAEFCCEGIGEAEPFSVVAQNTVHVWEEVLQAREDNEGVVYIAKLDEKDCRKNGTQDYYFFSTYTLAYEFLIEEKRGYLKDEHLKKVETYGEICRMKLNDERRDDDRYLFDNEMRLVEVVASIYIQDKGNVGSMANEYAFYVPTPFKAGDIVKSESPFYKTYYAVVPWDWKINEKPFKHTQVSVDIYDDEEDCFDFTDDTDILSLLYCKDELPKEQEPLKRISNIRKNDEDFMGLLWEYSTKSKKTSEREKQ